VSRPIEASEWDRLAELQRSLRALDSGGPVAEVSESVGRGVRLRLARLAVEEVIRRDHEQRTRRRRGEFELALAGFAERAAERARGVTLPLALPAPVAPTAPPPAPVTARAAVPARRRKAVPTAVPVRPRRAAPARSRPRNLPPPEFWSPRPVLAFRMWEVRGRLQGAWRAWDRPFREARCVSGRTERDDGAVPHTDGRCGEPPCGIYAFKEPEPLLAAFGLPEGSRRNVYGLVALSGKVVEHERGYRGQRAAVVAAAVLGRGLMVRVEGLDRLRSLFLAPEEAVAGLVATDPGVVEELDDPLEAVEAVIAYLSLAADLYEATSS
jgi:hypothetical protein